ncbi:MAG TPA: alpha-L-rhamnosidase C-terminal domain-containing protein [Dinghuibacter sp.]|uniref:alpha-L-rhamnosidase-related protein n=1 Tax=Dinghuibacter sp. TaxID=2024697 RepID=UPI002C300B8B|nr:alpha-L-rhamnosidase C-terminal domain-containing protein [Dinghuibacter sp.]HTJ13912.1 alpha-L-rhamnosidase C-terminal domain-containing protein [Dinghuibacter sp.]
MVRYVVCVIALLGPSFCDAQRTAWKADWIGIPTTIGDTNIWTAFRKTVDLDRVPAKAPARIATDSKYWLWVNGRLAVFEGGLKRGPNPRDTYFDTLDLARYLVKGRNTIAVLTWYWGRDGFDHKSSGRPALLFEASLGKHGVISDTTWRATRHPAFGNTGPPFPNFRLPEFNIHFDARKDMSGWNQPGFDDRTWTAVQAYGVPPVGPWNAMVERPIPLWKDSGLLDYINGAGIPPVSDGRVVIATLPRNITITPYLEIDAPAGLTIDIRTDNYKGGSEYNVRTEYVTRGGIQRFETFGYMNGHTVEYRIPPGVRIIALKYRETRYNTEQTGSFSCDDPILNTLWQKAYNTLNVNLRDAIQDPDRERAQWWGDAVILMGEILYACDGHGRQAIQKAMRNLVDWQKPDGVLYSPVPAGSWDKELPAQMLASIGDYGFWNYFRYTGDTALIRYVYPAVRKYLGLWQQGPDGLVIHRPGGWDWLDWGDDIDVPLLDNAWYCLALDAASRMAPLAGYTVDTAAYQARLRALRSGFDPAFWTGAAYASPAYAGRQNKGVIDDRGNGLAVVAGLAAPRRFDTLRHLLREDFHASPYMEKYILESFFLMHDAQGGLARMKKRYANMVNSRLTTLWEGWGIGPEGYGGGSYNHGWAGGPLTLLSQYVAGIAPDDPGFTTFHILPQPAYLRAIHCVVPTIKGDIRLDWARNPGEERLVVTIPPHTTAMVGIPKLDSALTRLSIKPRAAGAHARLSAPAGEDARYFFVRAQAGTWEIVLHPA